MTYIVTGLGPIIHVGRGKEGKGSLVSRARAEPPLRTAQGTAARIVSRCG